MSLYKKSPKYSGHRTLFARKNSVKFLIFLNLFLVLFGTNFCVNTEIPDEEDVEPCSVLVDGVYKYPTEKPDSTLSKEEIREYWNIPEDVLTCISTAGLIQSCYSTHNTIIIMSTDGYQLGYELVKGWNRGFDELENREDAATEFIRFYKNVELSQHVDYGLCCLEVAMAQDSVLKKLTNDEKIELLNLTLEYFPIKKEKYTNSLYYEGASIIMGRLMMFDQYSPFYEVVDRNVDISKFMDGIYRATISFENADTIVMFAENYLEEISE